MMKETTIPLTVNGAPVRCKVEEGSIVMGFKVVKGVMSAVVSRLDESDTEEDFDNVYERYDEFGDIEEDIDIQEVTDLINKRY